MEKKKMAVYQMTIQYEGGRYNGWQKQGNTQNTIQGKLEETFGKILGEDIEIQGAGRTDAGVHALGQVASFSYAKPGYPERWKKELNTYLPQDIRVLEIKKAEGRFHARLSATGKHYQYRIDNRETAGVFERRYSMWVPKKLSIPLMGQAARLLTGTHDYKAFCGNARMKKSTTRTVDHISILEENGIITIDFHGDGFLFHMARILAGTLIEVGLGQRKPEEMEEILESLDRKRAGACAESQGLFLVEVEYGKEKA